MHARRPAWIALWLLSTAAHTGEVRDDLGHAVRLARPATAIVTLAPHATELVIAAGAARRLTGISAGYLGGQLSDIPQVGGPGPIDRERLLQLQPDLVIAWHSGNRPADVAWLERQGIPVYHSEPAVLADIARTIRDIGRLSDTSDAADRSAADFERAILTPCAELPKRAAYVELWDRPPMTIGGRHWLNDALRAGGYRNVFESVPRGAFHVADEALLTLRDTTRISLRPVDTTAHDHRLADLLSRPTPGLARAIELLCAQRLAAAPRGTPSITAD